MAKKKTESEKKPEFKRHFYLNWFVQDWLGDQNLKLCPPDAKGFWMDMLMQMVLGFPFGHLSRLSKPLMRESKIKLLKTINLQKLPYQNSDQTPNQSAYQNPNQSGGQLGNQDDDLWVRLSVGLQLHEQLTIAASLEDQLSALTGYPPEKVKEWLSILDDLNIFSRTQSGIIYSRRLVRDFQKRKIAFINACNGINIYAEIGVNTQKKPKSHNDNDLQELPHQSANQSANQSADQIAADGYTNPLSNSSSSSNDVFNKESTSIGNGSVPIVEVVGQSETLEKEPAPPIQKSISTTTATAKNPISQMTTTIVQKPNQHIEFGKQLQKDQAFVQQLHESWKVDGIGVRDMVGEFNMFLVSKPKTHPNYNEYKSHFFNYFRAESQYMRHQPANRVKAAAEQQQYGKHNNNTNHNNTDEQLSKHQEREKRTRELEARRY